MGDIVKKGQILAIVEAMKLMNDIESDFDGEVAEILVSERLADSDFFAQRFHPVPAVYVGFGQEAVPFGVFIERGDFPSLFLAPFVEFFHIELMDPRGEIYRHGVHGVFIDEADSDDGGFFFPCASGVRIHMVHEASGVLFKVLHCGFVDEEQSFVFVARRRDGEALDFVREDPAAGEKVERQIDSAFRSLRKEKVQTVEDIRFHVERIFRFLVHHVVVEVVNTDQVVAGRRVFVKTPADVVPVGSGDVLIVDSEETDLFAGAFFKFKMIAYRLHKTVFAGGGVHEERKVDGASFFRQTGLGGNGNPVFVCGDDDGIFFFERGRAVAECCADDHPDGFSVAGEAQFADSSAGEGDRGCIESDFRGFVFRRPGDFRFRDPARVPEVRDVAAAENFFGNNFFIDKKSVGFHRYFPDRRIVFPFPGDGVE